MQTGFIKLFRKFTSWEWYSDHHVTRLFLHLLLTANYKSQKWRGIEIARGEVLTGRLSLAKATSLSQQQIRTSLTKLKSTNELTIRTTNKFSVIRLTNYDLYQVQDLEINQQNGQQTTKRATNNQPTTNQQLTTTKEEKERKEGKEGEEDNNFHSQCARKLSEIIQSKKQISIPDAKWKKWGNDFKLLELNDLKNRENAFGDIQSAFLALENHFGEQFFPVIESGKSFREKFGKIEAYVQRNSQQTQKPLSKSDQSLYNIFNTDLE